MLSIKKIAFGLCLVSCLQASSVYAGDYSGIHEVTPGMGFTNTADSRGEYHVILMPVESHVATNTRACDSRDRVLLACALGCGSSWLGLILYLIIK
jgi:hypothetical protein